MIYYFTFMGLIGSYGWMFTVCLFGDLFIGSVLIRGCDRFGRFLGQRYHAASRFCMFLSNPKNRENLVASLRISSVRGGG